jgi:hypothetical protein
VKVGCRHRSGAAESRSSRDGRTTNGQRLYAISTRSFVNPLWARVSAVFNGQPSMLAMSTNFKLL